MEQALNAPGPVVIEAVVDPNEPPMPPKVTRDQAVNSRSRCYVASRTARRSR